MAINCATDSSKLQELYNNVKEKVSTLKELKVLVTLWQDRESQKYPDYKYDTFPTSQDIDSLLSERNSEQAVNSVEEQISLEAKADAAFETVQKRQDRINTILRIFDKVAEQTYLNTSRKLAESGNTVAASHYDRKKSLTQNIQSIIDNTREFFNPNRKGLEGYKKEEFTKVYDNFDALFQEAAEILKVTDKINIRGEAVRDTLVEDNGDIDIEEDFKDSWTYKARYVDMRDSLSQKVRKLLFSIDKIGINGVSERDDLGVARTLQPDYVQSTLYEELAGSTSVKDFFKRLENMQRRHPWVKGIIDRLNSDKSLKSQFYQNFRKEFMPYWVEVPDRKNKNRMLNKQVNVTPSIYHMISQWRDNYESGSPLGPNPVYTFGGKILKENAAKNMEKITELQNSLPQNMENIGDNEKVFNTIYDLLYSVGVTISPDILRDVLNSQAPGKDTYLDYLIKALSVINSKIVAGDIREIKRKDGTVEYDDLINSFTKQYETIAKTLRTVPEDSVLTSFRELGKSFQSYAAPSYMGKVFNNLKNSNDEEFNDYINREFLYDEWFYTSEEGIRNEWLRRLKEDKKARNVFDRKIVMHSGKLGFNDWKDQKYARVIINQYLSTAGETGNTAYFYIPLLADADSAEFIKFYRYSKEECVDHLAKVVRQEYDRIMKVRARYEAGVNPITNYDIIYDKNGEEIGTVRNPEGKIISRRSGNEFKFFPTLNATSFLEELTYRITHRDPKVTDFIKGAVEDTLEQGYTEFRNLLHESKADAVDSNGNSLYFFDSTGKGFTAPEMENMLHDFYYNNAFAQSQIIELFTTDLAFYSGMIDFQKRFKEIYAQTLKLDTTSEYGKETETFIILKDQKIPFRELDSIKAALDARVAKGNLTKADAESIYERLKDVAPTTDAQAFRSPDSYRAVLDMCGRWTPEFEGALERFRDNTWTKEDLDIIWNTIKPFMFTNTKVPGNVPGHTDIRVPIQNKNSEFALLSSLIIDSEGTKSPKLQALADFMEKRNIDVAQFVSAVKVGAQGVIDLNDVNSYSEVMNRLEESTGYAQESPNKEVLHTVSYEDYGIQVETPEHHMDVYQLFGTQLRKLILSNIPENAIFHLGGKEYTKNEIVALYNSLITANVIEDFREIAERFNSIENIAETVQSELRGNMRYSNDLRKACSLIENVDLVTGEVKKEFYLPLHDPVQFNRTQHLLYSIIKNKVVNQKIRGGSVIQVTSFGYTDKLRIQYEGEGENKRIKYIPCYMPAWSKDIIEACWNEESKTLDITRLPKNLRQIIGYRIPTEGYSSMQPLLVVGFMPQQNGSTIMLPSEITTLVGSDFDVDKVYFIVPEFKSQRYDYARSKADYAGSLEGLSVLDSLIDGLVDDSYLEETPMDFQEWFSKNKEKYALEKPKLKYIRYDHSKSASENPVEARNNEIINIAYTLLTSPEGFQHIMNPQGFDKAKKAARICRIANNASPEAIMKETNASNIEAAYKILKDTPLSELDSLSKGFSAVYDPLNPVTQIKFHEQNATGGAMIGIYANNNAAHALCQYTDLISRGFVFNGKEYYSLHDVRNSEGSYISSNTGNFLGASVDNVKDPVLKDLMQNTATGDISSMMLRSGIEPNEVGLFMNQPIIKEISSALLEDTGTPRSAIIDKVLSSWATKTSETTKEEEARMKNVLAEDLFSAIIYAGTMDNITDVSTAPNRAQKQFYNFQYIVGKRFSDMFSIATDLAIQTSIMRVDTARGSAGPEIADSMSKEALAEGFARKEKPALYNVAIPNRDLNPFSDSLYEECMNSNLPFLQAFYTEGINGSRALLKRLFPQLGDSVRTMLLGSIDDGISGFLDYSIDGRLPSQDIKSIFNDLYVYLASGVEFFNTSMVDGKRIEGRENRDYFLNRFPKKFLDRVSKDSKLRENRFISKLTIQRPRRDGLPIQTLVFKNSGRLSQLQRDMYSRDWASLMYDPDTMDVAFDLFKYFHFLGGFGYGPNSAIYMAPSELRKAVPGYEKMLKDMMRGGDYSGFIEQWIANHKENRRFVPIISSEGLQVVDGLVAIEDSKLVDIMTMTSNKEQLTLRPLIAIDEGNTTSYWSPINRQVFNDETVYLTEVSTPGYKGKILEYDMSGEFSTVLSTAKQDSAEQFEEYETEPVGIPKVQRTEEVDNKTISGYSLRMVEDANGQFSCE